MKAARQAFDSGPWSRMTASERGKLIWKLADLLEQHLEEFATLETLDNGKPLTVARAADVPLAVEIFRYMGGWATKLEGTTIPLSVPYTPGAKYHAYTLREPVGVVGQIIPWNFPLLMAAWKLAPALACGCTVVLKPAEQTPLSALRLGELIAEAGFPDGVVNIVPGYGETAGAALAAHPDLVDKIAFTGSTEVGKLIVHAATGNLKKVSLELGGKSPKSSSKMPISTRHRRRGQRHLLQSRTMLLRRFAALRRAASLRSGSRRRGGSKPRRSASARASIRQRNMGPLVSEEQLDRVCGYLDIGCPKAPRPSPAGKKLGNKGYFVEPTVLVNTKDNMKVVQEEIFGPVVAAMPFDDPEELCHAPTTRCTVSPPASGRRNLQSPPPRRALRAGTVWINCYNIFDAALPFGGYKQSGWGREMGKDVLKLYTQTKAVCARL